MLLPSGQTFSRVTLIFFFSITAALTQNNGWQETKETEVLSFKKAMLEVLVYCRREGFVGSGR